VRAQTSQMQMLPSNTKLPSWETYNEDISSRDDIKMIATNGLLEQIDVTRDMSDYLWYITSVEVNPSEPFLHGGELPTLTVQSNGHALHVYINGQMSGSAYGTRENRKVTFTGKVNLRAGTNKIALLSIAVGLPASFGKGQTPVIDMDFENFHIVSLAKLPEEVMENVETLEITAVLHLQGNEVILPVIRISDGAELKFLMENLNYKEEELLHVINNDYGKDRSLQSSSLAIPHTSFSSHTFLNCAVFCFVAIPILYGLWFIVKRRQSKNVNELRGKKANVPKRKKSQKLVGRSG
ncbi:Beta-galactosidase, partial [Thalictrum thalictroides]